MALSSRTRSVTPSKRQLAAAVASRLGILRAVRTARSARGLLVLTYHRIGDPATSPVDGNLYTTTATGLVEHVRLLRRWTRVATLEEVLALYRSGKPAPEPLALLTFDDCYRDNYTDAFPVLRRAGVSGAFFVPTGLIGQRHVPWWDRLAYAVKHARVDHAALDYPEPFSLRDLRGKPDNALRLLLQRFKADRNLDVERYVSRVETALQARAADAPEVGELFAGWGELREMAEGGMALASHTHTHRLLGHLSYAEQREELSRSRDLLREQLGVETRAVAYPVGAPTHFNADTRRAMRELGYEVGFSHYGGWNPTPSDPYNIRRVKVGPEVTPAMLQAAVSLPGVFAA